MGDTFACSKIWPGPEVPRVNAISLACRSFSLSFKALTLNVEASTLCLPGLVLEHDCACH